MSVEVEQRTKEGMATYRAMKSIWKVKEVGMNAKRALCESIIGPTALYGGKALEERGMTLGNARVVCQNMSGWRAVVYGRAGAATWQGRGCPKLCLPVSPRQCHMKG